MIAFGYVRVGGDADTATVDTLHDQVTEFGTSEGYTVEDVYMDYGTPPDRVDRSGFQALVNVLEEQTDVAHVLVPDLGHLSPLPTTRTALLAKLGSLGSTVVECGGPRAPVTGLAARAD
jgi:DNA invertase Pin-like site-specific DNA recombinase